MTEGSGISPRAYSGTSVCPGCGEDRGDEFFVIQSAPVTVASVFWTADEARSVPRGRIGLTCCRVCGFIYNNSYVPELGETGARYESSQGASIHFTDFSRRLAEDWVRRFRLQSKRVVEVGAGDCAFTVQLLRAGAGTVLAVDPLADARLLPSDLSTRLEVDRSHFDTRHTEFEASALVCRHTLEHIPDVAQFISLLSAWAARNPSSPVLIEVPNTDPIVTGCEFWNVYYEHCNYFTAESLRSAFEAAEMRVEAVTTVYDGQYLVLEAYAGQSRISAPRTDAPEILARCRSFGEECQAAIDRCRKRLLGLADSRYPLVVWQGAAKTVALVTALGPNIPLACAVDLNPRRHGQHLPPYGLQIVPPETLSGIRPRHIVLMNPVYTNEVRAYLGALDLAVTLHSIDQLLGK